MLGVYGRVIPVYPRLFCRFSTLPPPCISTAVTAVLEANYRQNRYPTRTQFEEMSRTLGKSPDRLYNWYSRRRKKERKTEQIKESHPLSGNTRPRIPAVVKRALEAKYNDNRLPTRDELEKMSQELGESYQRLYTWFFKRREKERHTVKAVGLDSHPLLENLRPRISTALTATLEAKYVKNRYPTFEELETMSQELGEIQDRLTTWFGKRRIKERELMKLTGVEEKPGEFQVAPDRLDLSPYWPRLEVAFQQQLYPPVKTITLLAQELGVSWLSIAKWFTYRRNKERALRKQAGLDTSQFQRIGLKLHAKAKHLHEFLDRTQNLYPSESQLHELADRTGESVSVVRTWFTRRQNGMQWKR
ncbi:hypothetical protein CPB85DRAFT_1340023 [Mucidula mucida]|nr:hypothetical protein CPB85DRAFT_1340023 [Mucidula mucida]